MSGSFGLEIDNSGCFDRWSASQVVPAFGAPIMKAFGSLSLAFIVMPPL